MQRVISEDALSRTLERIDPTAISAWLRPALMGSVREALDRPWVLDIDASIKPLYGRQEGAELGYNPHTPGRLRHVLHTYWVGNLRMVLDVQATAPACSASAKSFEKAGGCMRIGSPLANVVVDRGRQHPADPASANTGPSAGALVYRTVDMTVARQRGRSRHASRLQLSSARCCIWLSRGCSAPR